MTPSATVCSALGDCTTVGPFGPLRGRPLPAAVVIPPVFVPPAIPPPVVSRCPERPTVGIYGAGGGADLRTLGQKVTRQVHLRRLGVGSPACTGSVANGSYVKTGSVGRSRSQ